ncbi:phosphoserine phosphatase SerB [Alteromonas sp. 1036]
MSDLDLPDVTSSLASCDFLNNKQSLHVEFDGASFHSSEELLPAPKSEHQVLVLVGQGINLWVICQLMRDLKIDNVRLFHHPFNMQFGQQVVLCELLTEVNELSNIRLIGLGAKYHMDIFNQSEVCLTSPGILVMDMDSTIIEIECIDEIAGLAGVKDKVAEVTEQAMRGEIAFTDSLKYRVACLQGVELNKLNLIRHRLPINQNFLATMQILKQHGWKLVLASGGFTFFADYVRDVANLDHAFSNLLEVEDGKLTGKVIGQIVDAQRKADILVNLTQEYDFPKRQSVAIGDGANDLVMMGEAGLGVAFRAKPAVQEAADAAINVTNFESLLYMMK